MGLLRKYYQEGGAQMVRLRKEKMKLITTQKVETNKIFTTDPFYQEENLVYKIGGLNINLSSMPMIAKRS